MLRIGYSPIGIALAACFGLGGATDAKEPGSGETVDEAICRLIETSAEAKELPVGFLTRLIWRESSFRPNVVSRAGAQGIARFMPGTARERGLADPFDPEAAIPAAAALLADLRRQFGNLGLAAAAYNAGPARVRGCRSCGETGLGCGKKIRFAKMVLSRPGVVGLGLPPRRSRLARGSTREIRGRSADERRAAPASARQARKCDSLPGRAEGEVRRSTWNHHALSREASVSASGEIVLSRPDMLRVSRTGVHPDVELVLDGMTFSACYRAFAFLDEPLLPFHLSS